jgi:hypothetical protein
MRYKCWECLILMVFVVVACTPASGVTVTPQSVPTLGLARITPTFNPTLMETPHPTEQYIFYDTPAPPTSTPTKTPTPIAHLWPTAYPHGSLSLPGWASNPDTPILLGPYLVESKTEWGEYDYQNLALWNGQTGERFDLDLPNIAGYFWAGKTLGLVIGPISEAAVWLVDLASGTITKQAFTGSSFRIENDPGGAKPAIYTPQELGLSEDPGIRTSDYRILRWTSYDGRYSWDYSDQQKIILTDSATGENFSPTDPEKNLYDLWAEWSPADPYLAIFNSDVEIGPYLYSETPAKLTISIYDVPNRRLLKTFEDIVLMNWSPDGQYILYQPAAGIDTPFGPPCLLNFQNEKMFCYYDLFQNYKYSAAGKTGFYEFRWSPDSQTFAFLYYTDDPNPPDSHAGVCIHNIGDGSTRCFLDSLSEKFEGDVPLTLNHYWPDPNWKVIFFELDRSCPRCDFVLPGGKRGFLDLTSGRTMIMDGRPDSDKSLWRP